MPIKKYIYRQLKPHRVVTKNPEHAWLEKNYPGYLHTIFMQGIHAGVFLTNKYFPFGFKVGYTYDLTTPAGEAEMDWFWDARELERVRNIFLRRGKKRMVFFNQFYRWWDMRCQIMLDTYRRAEKMDFNRMTDQELYDAYEELYWVNITQGAAGYVADCFLTVGETDWLSDFIASRVGAVKNINQVIVTLTAPAVPSYTNEEEMALTAIVRLIRRKFASYQQFRKYIASNQALTRRVSQHAARYYWVENNYFAKVLSPSHFLRRIYTMVNSAPPNRGMRTFKSNRQRKNRLLHELNDPWLTNVIRMSELMTHVQDYRKLGLIRFSHFVQLIFREMARRTGLEVVDFHNLVEPEMARVFLHRKFDKQLLLERRKKNFTYGTPRGFSVYSGKDLRKYVDDRLFHGDHRGITSVQGVPACQGFVRGTCRLVRNAHKVGVFNQGDILVTNNTTPEFVPLIKRAAAIVTDQGGITCHAAIISRELGIPCVIGTKIATKVFKDGDRVEVDAMKGVVKKI